MKTGLCTVLLAVACSLVPQALGFIPAATRLPARHVATQSRRSVSPVSTPRHAPSPLHADLGKIMADEIYRPMFFQAIFLSISGFLAAVGLGTIIVFKGEDLQKALMEEAYQERNELRSRLGTEEKADGTVMVGFKTNEETGESQAAEPTAAVEEEAPKEKARPRELVSAGAGDVDDFED